MPSQADTIRYIQAIEEPRGNPRTKRSKYGKEGKSSRVRGDACYIGSTVGAGQVLTTYREDTPDENRGGTRCDGVALGAVYDRIDGDLASQRRAMYRQRKLEKRLRSTHALPE